MAKAKVLLFNTKAYKLKEIEIASIVSNLERQKQYLHSIPIDDILNFFDLMVKKWKSSKTLQKTFMLRNLIDFFSKQNLTKKLEISLHGNHYALDKFVDLGDPKLLYHAQPRGITTQWLAGNTPLIGLFSIFSAILTKNTSIAKAPSSGYSDLLYLIQSISDIKTNKVDGKEILRAITLILLDSNDINAHQELSMSADVRMAWGRQETINIINTFPKKPYTEDIIFGPKYSFAIIDRESLNKNPSGIARSLAVDISVFDQYACTSPHTVFVQKDKTYTTHDFAKELSKQLAFVNRALIPKTPISSSKASEILSIRTEYQIKNVVYTSEGTQWTVVCTNEPGLFKGCFSRVIFVKPIDKIQSIDKYIDRQKQTLGVALTTRNKEKYLDTLTIPGIDRCPEIGKMTFFENPWDGMFIFDRLIRWVTTHKK